MISVLIPTLNEARNISECILSVRWAEEIVVVDSGSKDGTQEIAKRLGARVVEFRWNGRLPKKKNWALENIKWKNEWVLILDADERASPEMRSEIAEATRNGGVNGYFVNRRFLFMGKWIRHCGYYPSWNLRLFRHARGRYERLIDSDENCGDNEVHEHVILNGSTGYLRNELVHLAYPDIYTWIEKHNRYSNWEAQLEVSGEVSRHRGIGPELARKRWLRNFSRRLPFRPLLRFIYCYVIRRGFLDGYQGYVLCRLLSMYELLSVFKARELHPGTDLLSWAYRGGEKPKVKEMRNANLGQGES